MSFDYWSKCWRIKIQQNPRSFCLYFITWSTARLYSRWC
uniref:Uncharacterized protein n=1 Tax=Anguilla anguilla TaxID=7936 RepID=A0A0E9P635_ANGAN